MITIEYIAGFVDGEGCIYMNTKNNNKLDTRLTITNTDLSTLKDIQEFFNSGKIRIKSRNKNEKYKKICYVLDYWSAEAAIVIEQLLPYLRQKKEQARLVLECREFCLSRKKYEKGRTGRLPLTELEIQIRQQYITRIKELKYEQ